MPHSFFYTFSYFFALFTLFHTLSHFSHYLYLLYLTYTWTSFHTLLQHSVLVHTLSHYFTPFHTFAPYFTPSHAFSYHFVLFPYRLILSYITSFLDYIDISQYSVFHSHYMAHFLTSWKTVSICLISSVFSAQWQLLKRHGFHVVQDLR